jgi:hypothetical protein
MHPDKEHHSVHFTPIEMEALEIPTSPLSLEEAAVVYARNRLIFSTHVAALLDEDALTNMALKPSHEQLQDLAQTDQKVKEFGDLLYPLFSILRDIDSIYPD